VQNPHQEDVVMNGTKIILPLFLSLALLFSACGGGENSEEAREIEAQVADAPAKKELSPQEIGDTVGDLYWNAMNDIIELLKDKPDASAVKPKVEELKESYVQKLVELGKFRENLNEADKRMVDSRMRQKVYSASKQSWYSTFNEVQQHYFSNREFHKIVISFNVITQYAAYELLKKQEPEEAKRLGIE